MLKCSMQTQCELSLLIGILLPEMPEARVPAFGCTGGVLL